VDINSKLSVCAYFLSKFDMQAVKSLGYATRTEAMTNISLKLGKENQYLKRRRDEFDVFMDNSRKGQHNRKPTLAVKNYHEELRDLSFKDFEDKVKRIIDEQERYASYRIIYPDDLLDDSPEYLEGKKKMVAVNIYERNITARKLCIEHYGAICYICKFDFGKNYGEERKGLIHVHHLKKISEINEEYAVDPINDLRPVCPNCHMVLHSKSGGYTIEEVKAMLNGNYTQLQI